MAEFESILLVRQLSPLGRALVDRAREGTENNTPERF